MSSRRDEARNKEIPNIVVDPSSNKKYMKGKFLGKGGFAKCYELTDMETNKVYAGKIVPKSLLVKQHQKDKMAQEIEIHRSVHHKHIVGFHGFFEDSEHVYVLLELCRRRSLMELHRRRRTVTEPEARYFVRQVVTACDYLHKNRIIHRDLKLGNLFINEEMELKIGDFGLATKVDYDGERKRTLCGTPNYIAPEVLGKKGHSFEVDAWSLGCIVYTLLIGKPPFETTCLKDTYQRIKKNEYHVPSSRVSGAAKSLIQRLLRADPTARPNMASILEDDFFTTGFIPAGLPTSCLSMAPRFDTLKQATEPSRRALSELNRVSESVSSRMPSAVKREDIDALKRDGGDASRPESGRRPESKSEEPADCYLSQLLSQLTTVMATKPSDRPNANEDECEDPASVPVYWISKWVDYSDKYGLGYQLCDNSVGVLFNDSTRLILTNNGENVQYIERDGTEHFYTLKLFSESLTKKITLLKYFRNYMSEHLLKAGANMTPREGDEMSRLPFLRTWFRTRSAIVLHLSNGTLQINFFQDHTKIILCPVMQAVTYIDEKRDFRTFRLDRIEEYGCSKELTCRLRYAKTMVERLLTSKSGSGRVKSAQT